MHLQGEKRRSDGLQPKLDPHVVMNEGLSRRVLLLALICIPTLGIGKAPLDSLLACSQLTADTERLVCFDRVMTEIRKNSPTHAVPTVEADFGLSHTQELGRPSTQLHAHIVSVSRSATQRQVFVLDNAQTWVQIELEPDFTVRTGQEVTISKGALGSFWLSIDSHRATRVERIRSSKSG